MGNIIETNFGTLIDPKKIAQGSASSITSKGAFYVFTIRVAPDDIREYSFTDRNRANAMREVLISHLEARIRKNARKQA